MRNFQFLGNFDPVPILQALQVNADLWDTETLRTTHPDSPHNEVSDIWLRFTDLARWKETGNPADIIDQHESVPYPGWHRLPQVRPVIFDLLRRVEAVRLGRVVITRLGPGGQIAKHVDSGDHAAYYERVHCTLQSLPGASFHCEDESICPQPGSIFWFNNQKEHWIVNNSADDRITMIVDYRKAD